MEMWLQSIRQTLDGKRHFVVLKSEDEGRFFIAEISRGDALALHFADEDEPTEKELFHCLADLIDKGGTIEIIAAHLKTRDGEIYGEVEFSTFDEHHTLEVHPIDAIAIACYWLGYTTLDDAIPLNESDLYGTTIELQETTSDRMFKPLGREEISSL